MRDYFKVNDLITIDSDQWDDVGVVYQIEKVEYLVDTFSFNAILRNTETGYEYQRRVPFVQAQKVER